MDVASGSDRILYGSGHYQVAGWVASGIVVFPIVQGGPERGLWLLDPTSGAIRQVDSTHADWKVAAGRTVVGAIDPSDTDVGALAADEILSLDPATGNTSVFFRQLGARVAVLGSAGSGGLILTTQAGAGTGPVQVIAYEAGRQPRLLWTGDRTGGLQSYLGLNNPFPDRAGTWFTGPPDASGIQILFDSGSGPVQTVAKATGDTGFFYFVAGPCLSSR